MIGVRILETSEKVAGDVDLRGLVHGPSWVVLGLVGFRKMICRVGKYSEVI